MRDICPRTVPQQVRQNIVRSLVELDTLAYTRDTVIADKHPKNIMLTKTDDERMYTTVFIDFGAARFGRTSYYAHLPEIEGKFLPGTYVSPLAVASRLGHGTANQLLKSFLLGYMLFFLCSRLYSRVC